MKTCPVHGLRKDLPPMPQRTERIAALPVDERGYPIPFFVDYVDGKPDFRVMDGRKLRRCVRERLCWVCGQELGRFLTFVIGPMCAVNRNTAEPASHLDCAQWSVQACPFLSRPHMVRREDELTEAGEKNVAGIMIKRNPGVTCLWTTRSFRMIADTQKGGVLFRVGEPTAVEWWREGKPATLKEVEESIRTGLPALLEVSGSEAETAAIHKAVRAILPWLPNGELPL